MAVRDCTKMDKNGICEGRFALYKGGKCNFDNGWLCACYVAEKQKEKREQKKSD